MNRRVLYNRASADPAGRPWSERKKLVWWDADKNEWTGYDTPDFEKNKPPDYRPDDDAVGVAALRGDDPFVMQADGKAWLFAPNGVLDGPLPPTTSRTNRRCATRCISSRAIRRAKCMGAKTTRRTRRGPTRTARCSRSCSPRPG